MRQFFVEYKDSANLQQLVGEIPWGQNILIFSKIKDETEREYYIKACARFGWSRNVLLNQIKANIYKLSKTAPKQHNFERVLPSRLAEQADESIKDVITLDFLSIKKPFLERELEKNLVEKVKQFMLELGTGFSFIGNQYRLTLEDNEYFVDLLFFNRKLKCLVAVELKTGKFEPEYAGKMDFYLHLLNEQAKMDGENPPIGIILCSDKSGIVVEYALRSVKHAVGVAEYQITAKLPKELSKYIPTAKKFAEGLDRIKS
jgi:predicted nuclease of restriction endonuclease-like (RecB) superfamily